MATIKTDLVLDASSFEASVASARSSMDGMSDSASKIADALNEAASAEKAQKTNLKTLKKEFAQQKAIIQDCALKLRALGDAAKDTAGYKDLQNQMKIAHDKALEMKAGLDAAKESIADLKDKSKIDEISDQLSGLQDIGNTIGVNLGGLQSKFSQIKSGLKSLTSLVEKFNAESNKNNGLGFRTMSTNIKKVIADANAGKGSLGALNTALTNATASAGTLGQAFSKLGIVGKLGWIGAIVAGLMAFTKVAGEAVRASAEFGTAMADLSALTGKTGADLSVMREQIMAVAKDTNTSAKEVAKAFQDIAGAMPQLLDDAKGLEEMFRSVSMLSKSSGMSMEESTKALTTAMQQFSLQTENASYAVDVLANAAQKGGATQTEVAETLARCGVAAQKAGLQLNEAAAATELLAERQIKGAEAGTMLRNIFSKMNTAGIDELNPRVVGLTKALQNLKKYNNVQLKGIFGEEAVTGAAILADNVNKLDELCAALEREGTAAEQAAARGGTFTASLERMKTAWSNFMQSFNVDSGWGKALFGDLFDGITLIINALSDLVHAFDPLFEINTTDLFDVSPLKDFCGVVADLIKFVADLIKNVLEFGNVGTSVGNAVGNVFTAISVPLKIAREAIQWITWAMNQLFEIAGKVKDRLSKTFNNIPGIKQLKEALRAMHEWIRKIIDAYDELKRKLGVGGDEKKPQKNVKPEKPKGEEVWEKPYAKGSLSDLEAQLSKLEKDHKDGLTVYSAEQYKKEKSRIEALIKEKKKSLGIEDKSGKYGKSGSTKKEAKAGSVAALTKQMNDFKTAIDAGELNISTEEAYAKIKQFRDKIRKESIKIGKFKEGSLTDLNNQLKDVTDDFNNGLLDKKQYDKIADELKRKIESKTITLAINADSKKVAEIRSQIEKLLGEIESNKFTLALDVTDAQRQISTLKEQLSNELSINVNGKSISDIEATISQLQKEIKENKFYLAIDVDDAQNKIRNLEAELNKREFELNISTVLSPTTVNDMEKSLNILTSRMSEVDVPFTINSDVILTKYYQLIRKISSEMIAPKIDSDQLAEDIKAAQKMIESMKIEIGISADRTELDKQLKQLESDVAKHQSGGDKSSFDKATGGNQSYAEIKDTKVSADDKLAAIQAEMDYNDSLIEQLREMAELYKEMGDAGTEGYQKVSDKISEVTEKQTELGNAAKDIDKESKSTKKLAKNFNNAGDAIGSMGSAFSALGGAFESPELNVAGVIAQGIANIAMGAGQAIAQAGSLGPFGWIAAVAAIMATMAATVAQVHSITSGGYASGGIISGSSIVGDRNLARVNSGEMIINDNQQHRLWNIISGSESWNYGNGIAGGAVLESRVSGRDLILCLKNNEKLLNKSGKTIGIKV